MNIRWLIIAISILCNACIAGASNDKVVWKDFSSTDAGVNAAYPCDPKTEVTEYQYKPGKRYLYAFRCDVDGVRFQIMFGDHNPETGESVATFLRYAEGDFEQAVGRNNDVQTRDPVILDGFDARRYEVRKGNATILYLISANEKGALTTMVGPFSFNDSTNRRRAEKFIGSIHLIK